MIVAFMGNDGSGKTTISTEISEFFRELGFRTKYKHEYEYAALKVFFKVMGRDTLEKSRNEMLVQRKRSLRYMLWPYLVLIDLMIQLLYYRISMKNSIILLDRYPYDHYMSFKHLGNLTKIGEWLYLHFPKPDAFIVLAVDPHIAYERKRATHSYPLSYYVEQTTSYLELAKRLDAPTIDTSGDLKLTVRDTLLQVLSNEKICRKVIRKGIQNRMLFHALDRYGLWQSEMFSYLRRRYNLRKKMYEKSILCLHSILKNCEIKNYALIKTFDDFLFVGNDIDVVMPEAEFSRMRSHCLLGSEEYHVSLKHTSKTDSGKMDIQVLEGLNLDIHSYVGWDKIKYLGFDDLKNHVRNDDIHGFACSSLNNHANSCIVVLHAYERGYLTLDEFHYLRKNFEIEFLQRSFPDLSLTFGGYFNALDHVLRSKPSKFPHFFPLWSSTVWYLSMVRSGYGSGKVTAVLRNLGLIFFWNVRYRLKGKIPFEIDY